MTYQGPDGRIWLQQDGFWHCYEDGTIIQGLDQILADGSTKAEATLQRILGAFVEHKPGETSE